MRLYQFYHSENHLTLHKLEPRICGLSRIDLTSKFYLNLGFIAFDSRMIFTHNSLLNEFISTQEFTFNSLLHYVWLWENEKRDRGEKEMRNSRYEVLFGIREREREREKGMGYYYFLKRQKISPS